MWFAWSGKDNVARPSGRGGAVPVVVRSGNRPGRGGPPRLEWLENRILFAGDTLVSALMLPFTMLPAPTTVQTAHASSVLKSVNQVDLYKIHLFNAGDKVTASVSAQNAGSGLQSILRVFDGNGQQLALGDQEGGDPQLTFQAKAAGDYFVGVSSDGDNAYDPNMTLSGHGGTSTGLYTLDLQLRAGVTAMPDLTGSSLRLGADMALPGDSIPVTFAVDNRGAADPGKFQVEVLLASNELFDSSSQVLTTLSRADLTADVTGQRFSSPAGFQVTLPGNLLSGPCFVGLRLLPDPLVPDAGSSDKSGVHRGADFERLTVVTQVPLGVTDLSQVDTSLRTGTEGKLVTPDQTDVLSFTVTSALGNGRLTAEVAPIGGGRIPRLTLLGPKGQLLIQSDSGHLVQFLQPGTYGLTVSAGAAVGSYRFTSEFTQAQLPSAPLAVGTTPFSVVAADVDGDGTPDLITANYGDNTVGVLLGGGDGSFVPLTTFSTGIGPRSVVVADLNGDGKPDIITSNAGGGSVSVLLGNGDGSFQNQQSFVPGTHPTFVTEADVNGDGIPDLITANAGSNSASVLLGNGDGTFQAQRSFTVGASPYFVAVADINGDGMPDLITSNSGDNTASVLLGTGGGSFQLYDTLELGFIPNALAVADLNGDGKPDLVVPNFNAKSVSVLLGNGDGSFGSPTTFAAGNIPFSVAVADVDGDGTPDLVTSNSGDNTLSVLLGNGDGSFGPQKTFAAGASPRFAVVADINGDGKPDLVTADYGSNSVSVLLGNGDGSFQSQAPFARGTRPFSVAVGDLNHDGRPDLVTANFDDASVSVLLGNSDGSFQPHQSFAVGTRPISMALADVNDDGATDLITANAGDNSVGVLLGNGDGTFGPQQTFATGASPRSAVVADVNGDGIPDLITANAGDNTVSVLLGRGDGSFEAQQTFAAGAAPYSVAVADIDGDGIPDLITANSGDSSVSVLPGTGNGSFGLPATFPVDTRPTAVAVADVDGDGTPDLVIADYGGNTVGVLLGNGYGSFQGLRTFAVDSGPYSVKVADVDGDGTPDLITANYGGDTVSVLLGNGDGSFAPQQSFPTGRQPISVAVAEIDGDGRPDLIVADSGGNSLSVLRGNGDGSFGPLQTFVPGKKLYSAAAADVDGDGTPDLITANLRDGTVSVRLGNGGGSFQSPQAFAVGTQPTSVAAADLNDDGRPDLVTTNSDDNSVSVLLGNGDGTFQHQQTLAVGRSPRAVAVADVNGDGIPDLVVANYNDNTVSVLLGKGDGSFQPQRVHGVGHRPYAIAVADVDGDSAPDLLVANAADDTVSVLLGNGDGTWRPQQTVATGRQPFSLWVADVDGDHRPDLVTANYGDRSVSVLLSNGDGTFRPQRTFAVGAGPVAVAVADVNGDGKPDLIATNQADNTLSVLLGNGGGSFQPQQTFAADQQPVVTAVADVNGDGRPDLVTTSNHDNTFGVLLGKGDGSFQPASAAGGAEPRNTPFLVDLDGDSIPDSVIVDRSGNILFRQGLPGTDGGFAPPILLNSKEALHTSAARPARDLTVLQIDGRWVVAAADAGFDPALSLPNHFVFTTSLYTLTADDVVTRKTLFSTTGLPTRLLAAQLDSSGLVSLVAVNNLDNSVTFALQTAPGQFTGPITRPVGVAPSDIALVDVAGHQDGRKDIAVSDQASGDVTVLLNDPTTPFEQVERFQAGSGPFGIDTSSGSPAVTSPGQPVSLASGNFTGNGRMDLAVVNRGTHSFSVLTNDGRGGFLNSQQSHTTSTSDGVASNYQPGPVVAGYFQGAAKPIDLAILMEDTAQVWIFSGDGQGHFTHTFSIAAGSHPTGLTMVGNPTTGNIDLVVGNGFGDVLRLQGNGDGTFQAPPDNRVSLDVTRVKGQTQVLIGNADGSHVKTGSFLTGSDSLGPLTPVAAPLVTPTTPFAPGDARWYRLDENSVMPEAVVIDARGNRMQTYRFNTTMGTWVKTNDIPTGDDPVSVTIATLQGGSAPDMFVANKGSNDVSVILGTYQNGQWVGTPGPRLKSSGSGPLATSMVPDAGSPGGYDLAITNQDGAVSLLPGRGQGFFNDTTAATTLLNLGTTITDVSLLPSGTGGFAVAQDGRVLSFDVGSRSEQVTFTPPAGERVLAVEAVSASDVVVAESGGIVVDPELGETFRCLDGTPETPSALQVLQTPAGEEVLVTNAGQDKVYVFTVFSPESMTTPAQPPLSFLSEPNQGFVFTTTAIEEAPFAVVVTIAADTLPGGSGGSSTAQFLQTTQPTQAGGDDAGDAGGNVVAAATPATAPGFVPASDGTPGIDLYRRTDEPDFIRPMSRQRFPDALREAERMLASLDQNCPPDDEALASAVGLLKGEKSGRGSVSSEAAVAALEARRSAVLAWRDSPVTEPAQELGAGPIVPAKRDAIWMQANEPAAVVADSRRSRWLAVLPWLGVVWRPRGEPAAASPGSRPRGRRAWLPDGPRPHRPARRARGEGGDS
jgi:hypothetical protein